MTDKVLIRKLHCKTIIGIYPHEKEIQQDLFIDLEMFTDLVKAGTTDDINETVDYEAIKNQIVEYLSANSHGLIETVAEKIAEICLAHPKIRQVKVTVDKPGALSECESVAVEITRKEYSFTYSEADKESLPDQ